jgi:hypothetical protein
MSGEVEAILQLRSEVAKALYRHLHCVVFCDCQGDRLFMLCCGHIVCKHLILGGLQQLCEIVFVAVSVTIDM